MRIGAKKKPFYRLVVVEERSKRTGGYIELLGTYNPLTTPKDIKLNKERIEHWINMGAQPSVGYLRIIGKAIQKKPRKAKKPARNASPAHKATLNVADGQSDAGGEQKVEAPKAPVEEIATEASAQVPTEETKIETPTEETTPVEEPKQDAEATIEPTPKETK